MIRKFSLGVQPGKFLQGLGRWATPRRRRSLSLYRDTPEQRYLDFLSTQAKLLQRISLSRIASWHRTRIVSNRLVNDKLIVQSSNLKQLMTNASIMRQKRSHRIDIRLTLPEYEKAQLMADENNLTMSELFRAKTLKNRLPRRVTKVAGQTYWELGKIGNNLNQIAKAINTSVLMGEPVVVDRALLSQVKDLVKQVRREIAEIDLIADLQDEA